MPKKIQEAVTSQKLIRKFALVGAFSPQLDETIVPVVLIDDLSEVEEWRYGMLRDFRAAVAAEFNTWSLENPVNSGKVLQLLRAGFVSGAGTTPWVAVANDVTPSLATLLVPQFEDLRQIVLAATSFPAGQVRRQGLLAVFTGPEVWAARTLNNTLVEWTPQKVLVYPGARLFFQEQTINFAGELSIEFRERNLRPDGS